MNGTEEQISLEANPETVKVENVIVERFNNQEALRVIIGIYTMTQEELRSYRLTSMEEPSDEMLQAIMEQVAESARRSTAKFQAELHRRFEAIHKSCI